MSIIDSRYGRFNIIKDDTVISSSMELYGEWAQLEIDLLAHFIQPGDTVVDVGAFIGTHSRAFSQMVGKEGKVIAFEPRHDTVAYLIENASLASNNNVRVINSGLGATEKVLTVSSSQNDSRINYGARTLESINAQDEGGEVVTITTLDSCKLDRLEFIKIDVEGMELDVLKGAISTIEHCRPVIFAECNSLESGGPIIAWCRDFNYQGYGVISSAYNQNNYAKYDPNIFGEGQEAGLLLIPCERQIHYEEVLFNERLAKINALDDLVLLLLHKPQYPHEVFELSKASEILTLEYPSPLSDRLKKMVLAGEGEIASFQHAVAERDGQIAVLSQSVADRDGQIFGLNQAVADRDGQIFGLNQAVADRDGQIFGLNQAVADRDGRIFGLNQAVADRDGRIFGLNQAVADRDGQIFGLNQAMAERDGRIFGLNQALTVRDGEIAGLNQSVAERNVQISALIAERDEILNSTSWRVTRPVRFIGIQWKRLRRRITNPDSSAIGHGEGIELASSKTVQFNQSSELADDKLAIPRIDPNQTRDLFVEYQQNPPINPLAKLIAFYLPQFHPFPENDRWWGKGFTEWSNVGKALPNYVGHYQPHCPIHLGYYDLRVPEVMEEQAKLAKEYGIYGFSYYFYWFGGKILMDTPLELMLANKKVDIPFCLTWANENWSRRWDGLDNDILIAQNHSDEDSLAFIRHLVKYFKDERYIRIDGKPVLVIYRANSIPNMTSTAKIWRDEMLKHGIPGLYLVSIQVFGVNSPEEFDFDASAEFSPLNAPGPDISHNLEIVNPEFKGHIYSYERLVEQALSKEEPDYKLFRTAVLSWDNTARKQNNSQSFHGFSLQLYKQWLSLIVNKVCANQKYAADEKIVFVNAWNEWAEGAHLEPDRKFGYGYLQTTYDVLRQFNNNLSHQPNKVTSPSLSHSVSSMDDLAGSDAPRRYELRETSRQEPRTKRLIRVYQNYRERYPGFGGLSRLAYRCVDSVLSGGLKDLRNKVSIVENNINRVPALADSVAQQHNACQIDLLHKYLKKGRILNTTIIFDHNLGGGTNTYSRELVKIALADGGAVLRVYNFDCTIWFVQWLADGDEMLFYTRSIEELFKALTFSHGASIIVNSLYACPDTKEAISKIVGLVQALNAALDYKVNDFFALCPSPHLSDFNGEYCRVPQDSAICMLCLKKNLVWYPSGYPKENQPSDISEWRHPFVQLFEVATTVSFFDPSSIEIFRQVFRLEEHKIRVVPHVNDYFDCNEQMDLSGPLHIGVLGTLTNIKGVEIVRSLSDYFDERGLQIPISIVGACFVDMPPHIEVHGPYEQKQLPTIIKNKEINVILVSSIVPETFGYTISEAMKMGLPIVAFDLGAQGNRVKQYEFGKIVPLGSSPEIILAALQSALKKAQEKKK